MIIPEDLNLFCHFHSFSASAEALSFARPTHQIRDAEPHQDADVIAALCSQNHHPQSSTEHKQARLLPQDMSLTLSPGVIPHSELMSPGVG